MNMLVDGEWRTDAYQTTNEEGEFDRQETSFRDRVEDELERGSRTEAYESVYEFQEDATLVGGESPFAIPPGAVAEVILEAAVSPDPETRYPVGRFAELSLNARFLPDGLRDAAFSIVRKLP